jgi:hypothetical protein
MGISDIRLYVANIVALGLTMTEIEISLKIILLLVTIGYTLSRWINLKK